MIQRIYTGNDAMTLKVSVSSPYMQKLRLIVRDAKQQFTVLTNRIANVNGDFDFFINLPLCREYVELVIFNEKTGLDSSFTYKGFKKLPLKRRMDIIDFTKYNLRSYLVFIQKFCYNAGVLRTNKINNDQDFYRSDNWHFFIKYLPDIIDYETNQAVDTPCRISVDNGLIEVSQKYFKEYSVPMRMALLLHEYSHPFANIDPEDESEADINGLMMYLGLGYPRYEAAEAWCTVFTKTDTDENRERIKIIHQFIDDFYNKKIVFN